MNAYNSLTEEQKRTHIILPLILFIDGLKIDKYGRISLEAVLCCCGWFNRNARNRESSWFVLGFIEDQSNLDKQHLYTDADVKAQDYHDMLGFILSEIKHLRDGGGFKLTLDFGDGNIHDVIALPEIQFIIGD